MVGGVLVAWSWWGKEMCEVLEGRCWGYCGYRRWVLSG